MITFERLQELKQRGIKQIWYRGLFHVQSAVTAEWDIRFPELYFETEAEALADKKGE